MGLDAYLYNLNKPVNELENYTCLECEELAYWRNNYIVDCFFIKVGEKFKEDQYLIGRKHIKLLLRQLLEDVLADEELTKTWDNEKALIAIKSLAQVLIDRPEDTLFVYRASR